MRQSNLQKDLNMMSLFQGIHHITFCFQRVQINLLTINNTNLQNRLALFQLLNRAFFINNIKQIELT